MIRRRHLKNIWRLKPIVKHANLRPNNRKNCLYFVSCFLFGLVYIEENENNRMWFLFIKCSKTNTNIVWSSREIVLTRAQQLQQQNKSLFITPKYMRVVYWHFGVKSQHVIYLFVFSFYFFVSLLWTTKAQLTTYHILNWEWGKCISVSKCAFFSVAF